MANQVIARLAGDDYQHLFSWHQVLELLRPGTTVCLVRVEDADAMSVDDVTVHHADGRSQYFQVKCHVDHRSGYCEASLLDDDDNKSSLFQKWYRSYQSLRLQRPGLVPEIYLVSNWGWKEDDVLPPFVCALRETIDEGFYVAGPRSNAGKLRQRLMDHLKIGQNDLFEFLRSLRFRLAFGSFADLVDRVAERMHHLGIRADETSLHAAVGAVRKWIKEGPVDLTVDIVRARISELGLWLPKETPPSVHVHLMTIKDQRYDIAPDYCLDWRDCFLGPITSKGHDAVQPELWNGRMKSELLSLESTINTQTSARLIRVRGQARLSAWLAFGAVFSDVNRYVVEVDQQGALWASSATAAPDFQMIGNGPDGEIITETGDVVAVGISISVCVDDDVRRDVRERREGIRALLLLRPQREFGRGCLRDASDAVALGQQAKAIMREFAKKYRAKKILLYYCGPLGGACFLGHQLNAVCQEIQVMEHGADGYNPSFLLQMS